MPSSGYSASERARRLLAIMHLLRPGVSLSLEELAASLGVETGQLADDLELLALCGVDPYTPDQLIDAWLEDGNLVVMSQVPALDRPLRLSRTEVEALLLALEAVGFEADAPLVRKLASLGADAAEGVELLVRTAAAVREPGGTYSVLALAADERRKVAIEYLSAGGVGVSERVIHPYHLLNDRGTWYVHALCEKVGAERLFRLDRIRTATDAASDYTEAPPVPAAASFSPEGMPRAEVLLDASEPYDSREWPHSSGTPQPDGSVIIDLPYASPEWLARRVVARLGSARVLSPPEVRLAVSRLASETRGAI